MSEEFKIEIVNPEKSFLVKEDVSEVIVPAFEGEMGILKDHIAIISFLKPGIVKILSKSGNENYYVEDGIVEFKNNNLSILTSTIFNVTDMDKSKQQDLLRLAKEEANKSEINDGDDYVMVLYAALAGSSSTKHDAYKVLHFNKLDFTPPELHRFTVELLN